ncbi:hypothetical protein EMIHUDRAFT_223423 [Emiliania huxleyi CCMP1516]|uniref:Glycosyl transferase CAP10 domain-containing protein n=2 Tax=Emiliania huxleyi TaxID=2903 RepID=A0A0D3KVS6_EMIH1|nr:hypothetical protein EMIHUDRAFT_223423 [Emiliania huxleyi CCMP1516]EOD39861.1 hypothetical protein EMIHUDRAFT_223423 [Emiliania huxleyi CCMP1516]|eukprot:XP_005792290.1 hypothetical protein EMIHUDRAFT_223423 [Emiliania huxleyi CCMP1516]
MVQSRVAFGSSRERPTQLSRKAAARTTRRNSSSIPFFLPKRNDTDWVTLADGMAVADDTLWRWAGGVEGGLVNQRTGGHINYRGEGLVRGHGDKPPFRAAAAGRGTRLHRVPIRADAHRQDAPPCERPPATFALRFHWYARLRPWEHFVPVAENLADLPARVRWASDHPEEAAAIGARGRALAESLHELELACYWWQLLTAFAPLQSHLPRRLAARA